MFDMKRINLLPKAFVFCSLVCLPLVGLPLELSAQDTPELVWVQTVINAFSPATGTKHYVDPRTSVDQQGQPEAALPQNAFDSTSVEVRTKAIELAGAIPFDVTELIRCTEASGPIPVPDQTVNVAGSESGFDCAGLGTYSGLIIGRFESAGPTKPEGAFGQAVTVLQVNPSTQLRYHVMLAKDDGGIWRVTSKKFIGGYIE